MITERYVHWNNIIGSYFFSKNSDYKIYLYITRKQLIEYYKLNHNYAQMTDEDIWVDFIGAVNEVISQGFAEAIRNLNRIFKSNLINGGQYKYPLYLTLLVLLVLAKVEKEYENNKNVYNVIKEFFAENNIRMNEYIGEVLKSSASSIIGGKEIVNGGCWKDLQEWSRNFERGEFVYTLQERGQKFANLIREQAIFTRNAALRLPEFFAHAKINYSTDYSLTEFRNIILSNKRYLDDNIVEYVKSNNWRNIVSVIYHYFKEEWDGSVSVVERMNHVRKTLVPCYPCVEIDENGTLNVNYRLRIDDSNIDTLTLGDNNLEIENGWTKAFDSVPTSSSKYYVNLEDRPFYILISSYREKDFFFGSTRVELSSGETLLLLVPHGSDAIEDAVELEEYRTANWAIYTFVVPNDLSAIKGLQSIESKPVAKIQLCGGAKIAKGYLPTLMPHIVDTYKHHLVLKDDSCNELNLTCAERLDAFKWTIDDELPLGRYTISDSENPERDIEFEIVENESCGFKHSVKFNCYGHETEDESKPYYTDNTFVGYPELDNMVYPNEEYFQNNQDRYMCQTSQVVIEPNDADFSVLVGDMLIDWLYGRGKVSKKEFEETFFAFQSLYMRKLGLRYNYEIKVGSVVRWLQYQGYVDVDRNKNIIPCKPRFICLPVSTNHCNVLHLVGCRSLIMLRQLEEFCVNAELYSFHYDQVDSNYMRYRLTPSLIFIEVKGKANNNYGIDKVKTDICEVLGIEKPDFNFIRKMREFLPSLPDLISSLTWRDYEGSDYKDFEYDGCLFDSNTYSYGEYKCVTQIMNDLGIGESLVKVKRTNYDYRILIVKKSQDSIMYSELADENLGKFYIIYREHVRPNSPVVTDKCINQVREGGFSQYIGVLKRTHLPLMWEKLMNYMSIEIPFICNSIYKNEKCPFADQVKGFRIIDSPCLHTYENRCTHRYYLYNTNDSMFNRFIVSSIFRDKLQFEHFVNQKFRH